MSETLIGAGEFKARCLALLDDVARSGNALVVTKRGKPIARVSALEPAKPVRGSVIQCDDILTPAIDPDDWTMVGDR